MKTLRHLGMLFLTITILQAASAMEVPQLNWRDLEQGAFIGRGSFGTVYHGRWLNHEDVAIKILDVSTLSGHVQREFDREADIMWKSQYPRVVRLYGVCVEPGRNAMVLELMQMSLYDYLHSDAPLSDKQRWQWAIDIAQGLTDLHENHILHRDLKSQNILLDGRGRAKLADFGLAKFRLASSTATQHRSTGTLRWRAPELLSAIPPLPNASMDMFSYGVVLWEMLTRQFPFETQPDDSIIMVAIRDGAREQIPEPCPDGWSDLIRSCWNQEGKKRPKSVDVLERLTSSQPEKPIPPCWFFENKSIITMPSSGYRLLPAERQDWLKVLQYYRQHPVQGYDVGKVELVYNPDLQNKFSSSIKILQQRKGNPFFVPDWSRTASDVSCRTPIHQQLLTLSRPYVDENCPDVKLMPLWHGTQTVNIHSILSAGYAPLGSTDEYFGKGFYFTPEARYAHIYASRGGGDPSHAVLLLNWVASYSSYPIINTDFDRSTRRLVSQPAAKYDARFIPVVKDTLSHNYWDNIPIREGERHQNTEIVILNGDQVLPRYCITLQPTLASSSQEDVMNRMLEAQTRQREREREKLANSSLRISTVSSSVLKIGGAGGGASAAATDLPVKQSIFEMIRDFVYPATAVSAASVDLPVSSSASGDIASLTPDAAPPVVSVERPLVTPIPAIARGNESIYERFLRGKLIYRPTAGSDVGKVELSISDFLTRGQNPLESTFDLSRCGDAATYLSISTGYRREATKSANPSKWEVFITPKFLIEAHKTSTASHYAAISNASWTAPFAVIQNYGGWANVNWYWYHTTLSDENLNTKNLYEICRTSKRHAHNQYTNPSHYTGVAVYLQF